VLQQYFCRVKILDKKPCGKEKIMGYATELFSYIKIAIDNGAALGELLAYRLSKLQVDVTCKRKPGGKNRHTQFDVFIPVWCI